MHGHACVQSDESVRFLLRLGSKASVTISVFAPEPELALALQWKRRYFYVKQRAKTHAIMHYELQWAALRNQGGALPALVDPVPRPTPCSRPNFGRSGQCSVLWHVYETRKTTPGSAAAKKFLRYDFQLGLRVHVLWLRWKIGRYAPRISSFLVSGTVRGPR